MKKQEANVVKSIKDLKYINQDTNEEVFTKEQVAKILKISLSTIRITMHKLHKVDGFIYYKHGGSYYYPMSTIDMFKKLRKEKSRVAKDSILYLDQQFFSMAFIAKILKINLTTLYKILLKFHNDDRFVCYKYKKALYYKQSVIDILKNEYKKHKKTI